MRRIKRLEEIVVRLERRVEEIENVIANLMKYLKVEYVYSPAKKEIKKIVKEKK